MQFERVGQKIMLVQPNQSFRSSSPNALERKSVEDSFAKSILWGFTVAAESGGRVLVDATPFFLRDVTNAASALRPGAYRLDQTRSAFYVPNTRNFPKNTEVDMTLTFVSDGGGGRGGGNAAGPSQGPQPIGAGNAAAAAEAAAAAAAACFPGRSRASRRRPTRSRCASTRRSSSCPTATTSRASTIRARATAA